MNSRAIGIDNSMCALSHSPAIYEPMFMYDGLKLPIQSVTVCAFHSAVFVSPHLLCYYNKVVMLSMALNETA